MHLERALGELQRPRMSILFAIWDPGAAPFDVQVVPWMSIFQIVLPKYLLIAFLMDFWWFGWLFFDMLFWCFSLPTSSAFRSCLVYVFFTEFVHRLWIGKLSAICVLHSKTNGFNVFRICANSNLPVDVFKDRHRFLDVFALVFMIFSVVQRSRFQNVFGIYF